MGDMNERIAKNKAKHSRTYIPKILLNGLTTKGA